MDLLKGLNNRHLEAVEHFGSLSFQLTKFNSFLQPFSFSDKIPNSSVISNTNFGSNISEVNIEKKGIIFSFVVFLSTVFLFF